MWVIYAPFFFRLIVKGYLNGNTLRVILFSFPEYNALCMYQFPTSLKNRLVFLYNYNLMQQKNNGIMKKQLNKIQYIPQAIHFHNLHPLIFEQVNSN